MYRKSMSFLHVITGAADVGADVVGSLLGWCVGVAEGIAVGEAVGVADGRELRVGWLVGSKLIEG